MTYDLLILNFEASETYITDALVALLTEAQSNMAAFLCVLYPQNHHALNHQGRIQGFF